MALTSGGDEHKVLQVGSKSKPGDCARNYEGEKAWHRGHSLFQKEGRLHSNYASWQLWQARC
jgi:hypothetical protein